MKIPTERYETQAARWPREGRHILAHFDDSSIIVYQAYRPSIALHALEHGHFGGRDFSFSRMSWVKPNFLWMMHRSGWGTKEGQEMTLGLRLRRDFFESILRQAVSSTYDPTVFADHAEWKSALANSDVRLQWDPDHSPSGARLERRAIQLGLRGDVLNALAKDELLEVMDLTDFVTSQRERANASNPVGLQTPIETVYVPTDVDVRSRIGELKSILVYSIPNASHDDQAARFC
jgi:hypothetical protein